VKEIFRGSGFPFEPGTPDSIVARTYFRQTSDSDEEAVRQAYGNEKRLKELQKKLMDNLETVIVPDIRLRTDYRGDRFEFQWVYNQGEHLIEKNSRYRIPLG
jgi:hypothetical protein